jgi:hypothetical protein
MIISITEFKQRCLEIIRGIEKTGQPVAITRRGKIVACVQRFGTQATESGERPWEQLRRLGGHLHAAPGDSVLANGDFEALR